MKRIFITFLVFLITAISDTFAQTDSIASFKADSIASFTSECVYNLYSLQRQQIMSNRYKMYPTDNLYNFLKLDTQTGRIDQVQWSLKSNEEFSTVLNGEDLSLTWTTDMNSFELYPTQNIYQFILLDKATGRTWHVQWGHSRDKRLIRRIY